MLDTVFAPIIHQSLQHRSSTGQTDVATTQIQSREAVLERTRSGRSASREVMIDLIGRSGYSTCSYRIDAVDWECYRLGHVSVYRHVDCRSLMLCVKWPKVR